LRAAGFIAMGGQIVDATVVAAPKQRNTEDEKQALREGRIPEDWARKPAKLAQKGEPRVAIGSRPMAKDARWTVKQGQGQGRTRRGAIAIPVYGYKNPVGIDRRHGLIRTWTATDAARHDGAEPPAVLDRTNTANAVWAGGPCCATGPSDRGDAYRSAQNEAHLAGAGFIIGAKPRARHAETDRPRQCGEVRGAFPGGACSSPGRRGRWVWWSAPSASPAPG
jgi:IS5 family transposase